MREIRIWKSKVRKMIRAGIALLLVVGSMGLGRSETVYGQEEHQMSFLRQEVAHVFLRGAGGVDRGDMKEAVLAVDGRQVFCMEPYVNFKEGRGQKIPMEAYQIDEAVLKRLGLEAYYITHLSAQKNTDAGYILAQIHLWRSLSPYKGWDCGETYAKEYAHLSSVYEEAKRWAEENAPYYQVWLQLYQGVDKGQITMEVNVKKYGSIRLKKDTAQAEFTEGNPAYSLAGAEYGVYKKGTEEKVTTLVTDEKGEAQAYLPEGEYEVKEVKAPTGYALSKTVYQVSVRWEEEVMVNGGALQEAPQYDQVRLLLKKIDKETKKNAPQGGAALEDARFEIAFYPGYYNTSPQEEGGEARKKWIVRTDKKGQAFLKEDYLVSGDPFYRNKEGIPVLPLGTVTIREIAPPKGYLSDPAVYVRKLVGYGEEEKVSLYEAVEIKEQIVRGDLEGIKVEASTERRMGNVRFRITSATTGESHEILTDENGYFSTASDKNPHTRHTNRGKEAGDGIWFGEGEPNDELGALPFDTYILDEMEGKENEGKKLIKGLKVVVDEEKKKINLGTIRNEDLEKPSMRIRTQAKAEDGKKEILPQKGQKFRDVVEFEGKHIKEKEVLVRGQVMRKSSRSPLEIDGKEVITEKKVVISSKKGKAEMEFEVDATNLAGEELVIFESVYDEEGKLLGKEEDYENSAQTIRVKKPGEPQKGVKTGDSGQMFKWMVLWGSGAAVICIWIRTRRRKRI